MENATSRRFRPWLLVLVSFTLLILSSTIPKIHAADSFKPTGKEFNMVGAVGPVQVTLTGKILKDKTERNKLYPCLDLCPPMRHFPGTGDMPMTYTRSVSYKSEKTSGFGAGIEVTVPLKIVELTVKAEGALSSTNGKEFAYAGGTGKTVPSSAKEGYYKLTVVHNYHMYRVDMYYKDTKLDTSYRIPIPYEGPYLAVVYSKNNELNEYVLFKK